MTLDDQVATGRFLNYEKHAFKRLRRSLPASETNEDLFADVRVMALEASHRFDVDRGGRFESFLYRHLQIKSMEKLRSFWRLRRRPQILSTKGPDEIPMERCPSVQAEIAELLSQVSDPTRNIVRKALENNTTELRSALGMRTWRFKVGTMLEVSSSSVAAAVAELQREIPRHISSLEI